MTQTEIQENFIQKGIEFYKTNSIGYYNIAMRTGKCKITIELLRRIYEYDCTILIAYPDNKLKKTWEDELKKWRYDNPNITFINFSSLKKHTTHCFDVFIIDEFHSCSPLEVVYTEMIRYNCEKTICLSGTVSEETKNNWNIPQIAEYSTLQGIDDGILADYKITIHTVDLDNKIKIKDKKGKFKTEKQKYDAYSWVMDNIRRQGGSVMHLALARNRLSLSSIGKMTYLKTILAKLHDKRVIVFAGLSKVADESGIPSYHTKSKNDKNFIDFQEGRINQLALAAMGKMGITYPDLDSVILLNFTYNAEESSQILNRAIKLDYKDKIADLHIICLNESAELKKIKESLSMLDKSKITYL